MAVICVRPLIHGVPAASPGGAQRRRAQHLSESAKLRGGPNVAEVGLANKDPRVMWALLARGDFYRKGSAMDRSSAA